MLVTTRDEIKTKWFLPLLYILCVFLLLMRKPIDVLLLPGRWEDVYIYLLPAIQHSWASIFFIHYYYFMLVPTMTAFFSLQVLGIANAPIGMNLAAIVIAPLCGIFFATKQFRFMLKNDLLRAICSLFIILVPGITEQVYSTISGVYVFLNVFIMLFVMLLLFRYDEFEKKPTKVKYLYTFFCSVSFLTSAFSVIFFPVLVYVIIRQLRRRDKVVAISSYLISTGILVVQTITIGISYLQQSKSSVPDAHNIFLSTINGFTISTTKIFFYKTPDFFQHAGEWMYLIPIILVTFILLNSIKKGIKLELYVLICIIATLFFSDIVRSSDIDWSCLCGQAQERYFFFAMVFLFILTIRQLDRKKSVPFRMIFSIIMVVVMVNITSGFFIPINADESWKYVKEFYDPLGKYQCYIGNLPLWSMEIPCSKPIPNNVTSAGSSVTFTPPVQPTVTSITSSSSSAKFGQSITFTATVSPTPDYGQVQFYIDGIATGKPIPLFSGQSIFSISLPVGTHQVYASFLGAPDFTASNSGNMTVSVLSVSNP